MHTPGASDTEDPTASKHIGPGKDPTAPPASIGPGKDPTAPPASTHGMEKAQGHQKRQAEQSNRRSCQSPPAKR